MANVADSIFTMKDYEGDAVPISFAFVSKRDQRIIGTLGHKISQEGPAGTVAHER